MSRLPDPMPTVGARVYHDGQQYPRARQGTGTVALIAGPYADGRWECLIYHHAGFGGTGVAGPPSWWDSRRMNVAQG